MTTKNDRQTTDGADAGGQRAELIRLVERWTKEANAPYQTTIGGLRFSRFTEQTQPTFYIQETAVCFVLQGRKTVMLGKESYVYDAASCLVATVELPVAGCVSPESADKPYLGIVLNVNSKDLAALIIETGRQPSRRDENGARALSITKITLALADPLLRLVKLLDAPAEIPVMAPMIKREINFRLLQTEQFDLLSQAVVGDGKLGRVAHAISWLKENLTSTLRIEELAGQVHMSPSGLHHQFKEVTALSPVQFLKRLRLQKARQMIMTDKTSAEKIAYLVGYESPSQFNREYRRLFGEPPKRDANRMRGQISIYDDHPVRN